LTPVNHSSLKKCSHHSCCMSPAGILSRMPKVQWPELQSKSALRVVGLMSGTSADGIDAALVDVGPRGAKLRAFAMYPYPAAVRKEVLALCAGPASVGRVCHANALLGELFAEAVIRLADKSGVSLRRIDLIGSHGQTICHLPVRRRAGRRQIRSTLQIAEPSIIAERTGITTVADFRPWCRLRITCCSPMTAAAACCATLAASPTSRICRPAGKSPTCWPLIPGRATW
jgi:hypothetical protein